MLVTTNMERRNKTCHIVKYIKTKNENCKISYLGLTCSSATKRNVRKMKSQYEIVIFADEGVYSLRNLLELANIEENYLAQSVKLKVFAYRNE